MKRSRETYTSGSHLFDTVPDKVGLSLIPNSKGDEIHVLGSRIKLDVHALKLKLKWHQKPKSILIIKKWKSDEITEQMRVISDWLTKHNIIVIVEHAVNDDFPEYICFNNDILDRSVDLIITLGGDGTVLYANSLFQGRECVPPMITFAAGTLGFLTPFDFSNYQEYIQNVLDATDIPIPITLRVRLHCRVYSGGKCVAEYWPLNEMLISRASTYIAYTDFYVDNSLATTIQSDGIIVATATGSTAYSMSAGGSMAPPTVPCILVTPVCPHSLSLRPLILPDTSELKFKIPDKNTQDGVYVCFDGRNQHKLEVGDYIKVRRSSKPVPTFNLKGSHKEWFASIKSKLGWNIREIDTLNRSQSFMEMFDDSI